jgi:nucleoside-diphosphate-sugar epimerase
MTILVTGASGFIGRHLASALAINNFHIRAVLRKYSDTAAFIFDEVFFINELSSQTNWQDSLEGVDTVIHLAGKAHVLKGKSSKSLDEHREINFHGTINLALQAAKSGVRRFIFLSSIKVNGKHTFVNRPFRADDIANPSDEYAISKHEAELGLKKISRETGMEVVIIRPPLVYGPGVKANFLSMMKWISQPIPLPFGAINNLRSLVSVDNLIDLIIRCINHPGAVNRVFLVSDGEDLSTTSLLYRMGIALNKPVRLISTPIQYLYFFAKFFRHHDLATSLCSSLQVDISETCRILGWSPIINTDEGLRKTAEDFRKNEAIF